MAVDDFDVVRSAPHGPVETKKKAYWVKFAIPFDIVDKARKCLKRLAKSKKDSR